MKVINVVGARPNFMKIAPVHAALSSVPGIKSMLVHTGQHADFCMSEIFLKQLNMPEPDYSLRVTTAAPGAQVAEIMAGFCAILQVEKPDLVVVAGDVNSTLACALAASKAGISLAHVEAGLRSFDRSMPEEINRKLTDMLSDYLFVTEQSAIRNLLAEHIPMHKIHFVGNVMIDSLRKCLEMPSFQHMGTGKKEYILWTMHRPSNVDTPLMLGKMLDIIAGLGRKWKVVFPVHPRTMKNLHTYGFADRLSNLENVQVLPPQGYVEFLNLMAGAMAVVTDSGGVQEETTFMQVPCITLRTTTERPATVIQGSNDLLYPFDYESIASRILTIQQGLWKKGSIPEYWDGQAARRIASILQAAYLGEPHG